MLVLSAGAALAQPGPQGIRDTSQRQAARNYNIQSRVDMQERQIRQQHA